MGIALFQTLPLLGQKLENRLLAARKAEARANPIEQLQNFLMQKRERVRAFKGAVVQIGAQIKSMSDMIDERKRQKGRLDKLKTLSTKKAGVGIVHAFSPLFFFFFRLFQTPGTPQCFREKRNGGEKEGKRRKREGWL
ncbi:hypothetical protein HSX11_16465 [Oxalobacteraceae bacterium]|nr:hypothetical protein [Oxalobacteraceae bacterium]